MYACGLAILAFASQHICSLGLAHDNKVFYAYMTIETRLVDICL